MRAHERKRSLFIACLLACLWCCFPSLHLSQHFHIRRPAAAKPRAHRNVLKATEPSLGHLTLSLVPSQPFPGTYFLSVCFPRKEVVTSFLDCLFRRQRHETRKAEVHAPDQAVQLAAALGHLPSLLSPAPHSDPLMRHRRGRVSVF